MTGRPVSFQETGGAVRAGLAGLASGDAAPRGGAKWGRVRQDDFWRTNAQLLRERADGELACKGRDRFPGATLAFAVRAAGRSAKRGSVGRRTTGWNVRTG